MKTFRSYADMVGTRRRAGEGRTRIYAAIPSVDDHVVAAIRADMSTQQLVQSGLVELEGAEGAKRMTSDTAPDYVEALLASLPEGEAVALRAVTLDDELLAELERSADAHGMTVAELVSLALAHGARQSAPQLQ